MTDSDFWTSYNYVTLLLKELGMRKGLQNHKHIPYSKDLITVSKKGDLSKLYDYMSENLDYDILLKDDSMITMNMQDGLVKMTFIQRPTKYIEFMNFVSEYHKDALREFNKEEYLWELYNEEYQQHLDTLELNKAALYIRYDEDPDSYKVNTHPYIHIHIGMNNNIRIPSSVEITPLSFTFFILQQVYYDKWVSEFNKQKDAINHILEYSKKDKTISVDAMHWQDNESVFIHLTKN